MNNNILRQLFCVINLKLMLILNIICFLYANYDVKIEYLGKYFIFLLLIEN